MSNGLVESTVERFKEGLERIKSGSLNTCISRFLLTYQTTPDSLTGSTPLELLMGRRLRTQLDLLRLNLDSKEQDRQKQRPVHMPSRQFAVGDTVYVRNYGGGG